MIRCSFSEDKEGQILNVTLPDSWNDLSDAELLKVFKVLQLTALSESSALTLILMSLLNLRVVRKDDLGWVVARRGLFRRRHLIRSYEFQAMIDHLKFIFAEAVYPFRLTHIGRHQAADCELRGVDFRVYLTCDNLYQNYLASKKTEYLRRMASFLYGYRKIRLNEATALSVFYWWTSLKRFYTSRYPFLFMAKEGGASSVDMEDSMNSLIRALTGGDATKEDLVLSLDTNRALNELNQKAREIAELKKQKK